MITNLGGFQLEGSEQERSLDFSAIFESVHMPKFNYFWTLSKMAEKIKGSFLLWALQLIVKQILLVSTKGNV